MDGVYCAIQRIDNRADLCHFKYIKKVKKNGKWRYYYDRDTNPYDTNSYDYEKKIKEIENTQEWKDIVARNDPYYVVTDKNGNKKYLIGDYLVDKKHPELKALRDLSEGKKIKIHKITEGSVAAGLNDYVRSAQNLIGIGATFLREKFKFSQGSYSKDIENAENSVKRGASFVSDVLKIASEYTKELSKYG